MDPSMPVLSAPYQMTLCHPPPISYSADSRYTSSAEAVFQMSCGLGVAGNGKLDGSQFMAIRQRSEA